MKGTTHKPDLSTQHKNTALLSVTTQGSPTFPDSKICHFGPTISHSALADETQTKSMCACPGLSQGGDMASSCSLLYISGLSTLEEIKTTPFYRHFWPGPTLKQS